MRLESAGRVEIAVLQTGKRRRLKISWIGLAALFIQASSPTLHLKKQEILKNVDDTKNSPSWPITECWAGNSLAQPTELVQT